MLFRKIIAAYFENYTTHKYKMQNYLLLKLVLHMFAIGP
jgi:hypothetical protein